MSALVFLHPIGLDARCADWPAVDWDYVPTFPGHGGRPLPPGPLPPGPLTLAAIADEIAATGPRQMHVVGALMGGAVALHLALRHPGRVSSLLIVATTARTDRDQLLARADAVEAGDLQVDDTIGRWFRAEVLARPYDPVDYARASLAAMDPHAMAESWRALAGHDVLSQLQQIQVPTTFAAGRYDVVHPPATAEANAGAVPHGRFAVIESAHMAPLDNPGGFAEAVRDHLSWASGH